MYLIQVMPGVIFSSEAIGRGIDESSAAVRMTAKQVRAQVLQSPAERDEAGDAPTPQESLF